MSYHIGFLMSQTAGHVTNYRNLRRVTDADPTVCAHWHEINYYRPNGAIERIRERVLPAVPAHLTSISRAIYETRNGLRSGPFDALMVNETVAVLFTPTIRHIPTMLDFDATPVQIDRMPAYNSPQDAWPVERIKYHLWHQFMRAVTLLHAWSRWAKQSAIVDYGVPAERVVVNPPGVDLDLWRPWPRADDDQDDRHPLRVLFVGADFTRKGGDLLLEWFRTRQGGDCELHLVTREPVAPAPGVFVYHSMQPNSPELLRLYAQCDLFVLPSRAECFGIATVEAMAAGLPVIMSDVGGVHDIVEPGRNGDIVPPSDVAALSVAIERLLGDSALRQAMRRQSRLLAEQRFDLQKNARRTLDHLKQIADARCAFAGGSRG